MERGKLIAVNTFTNKNERLEINGKIPRSKTRERTTTLKKKKQIFLFILLTATYPAQCLACSSVE